MSQKQFKCQVAAPSMKEVITMYIGVNLSGGHCTYMKMCINKYMNKYMDIEINMD
jgi:hypothetical protein